MQGPHVTSTLCARDICVWTVRSQRAYLTNDYRVCRKGTIWQHHPYINFHYVNLRITLPHKQSWDHFHDLLWSGRTNLKGAERHTCTPLNPFKPNFISKFIKRYFQCLFSLRWFLIRWSPWFIGTMQISNTLHEGVKIRLLLSMTPPWDRTTHKPAALVRVNSLYGCLRLRLKVRPETSQK